VGSLASIRSAMAHPCSIMVVNSLEWTYCNRSGFGANGEQRQFPPPFFSQERAVNVRPEGKVAAPGFGQPAWVAKKRAGGCPGGS
jgi:hypothetical protein